MTESTEPEWVWLEKYQGWVRQHDPRTQSGVAPMEQAPIEDEPTRFVMAENRARYAAWCGRQGWKQSQAVYVNNPEKLDGRTISPSRFVFVEGWQKNKLHTELMAAYGHATRLHWESTQ